MIEKMKFLSITGPKSDIDRVADVYLSKYEMHLENTLSELDSVKYLRPILEMNPYKELLNKADELVASLPSTTFSSKKEMSISEAANIISDAHKSLLSFREKKEALKAQKNELNDLLHKIEPFRILNFDIASIVDFNFIKFRYGKISHEHFNKFLKYEYSNLDVIFFESDSDDSFVWGMYFVPSKEADKLDAIFSSLHFERIHLPKNASGTTEEIYQEYATKLKDVSTQLKKLRNELKSEFSELAPDILLAKDLLYNISKNSDIRKFAACTRDKSILSNSDHAVFYIICGWMRETDALTFLKEIEDDPNVFCISEDGQKTTSTPPTKLKNPKIFKPFEMFVKLYGLPAYNELDPTIFLALTYSIIFGMMFGDVGQGLLLCIGGLLLYKFKKLNLYAIIASAGFFSAIFGLLYGSVFGFEEVIESVWIKPMNDINTILFTSIGFGLALILIAMVLNIINGIKSGNIERILFDTNGLAGFIFYGTLITCVVIYLLGYNLPPTWLIVTVLVIPLIVIFLREPLGRIAEKKKNIIPGGKVMFFVEAFFELFEILLSFLTNSLSFVRVGAFALSHAGMMGVVLMLASAETSHPNILVLIIGNLFVMALEGLCVGIQVLRLEYFEMFSRYYGGSGREFVPFRKAS